MSDRTHLLVIIAMVSIGFPLLRKLAQRLGVEARESESFHLEKPTSPLALSQRLWIIVGIGTALILVTGAFAIAFASYEHPSS